MKKFLSILLCAILLVGSAFTGTATHVLYGDIDDDGIISAGDARLALRNSVGLEELTANELLLADVDGDGIVTAGDARSILRGSVGLDNTNNFGIKGSQIFMSGNFVMSAVIDEESGTKFTIAQTENSSYMEATMDIDMSDGATNTGKPVRIGFLTIHEGNQEGVYWVLPDDTPVSYLKIDAKVTENMGIDADMFKELIPQIMTPQIGRTPDEQIVVNINGYNYNRWVYENEDDSSIAHDMSGVNLEYIRTFDADGNETSVMRVNSISRDFETYHHRISGMLFASKEGDAEDDIGYITTFLMRFAALANIPLDDEDLPV